LLKTIPREEFKLLKKILRNYHNHIKDNPDTLISKVFGMHKVIFSQKKLRRNFKKQYFIIMDNVFNTGLQVD
jgi:1-phosphatidylinositol-4-phosphate 5-kinase